MRPLHSCSLEPHQQGFLRVFSRQIPIYQIYKRDHGRGSKAMLLVHLKLVWIDKYPVDMDFLFQARVLLPEIVPVEIFLVKKVSRK